MQRSRLYTQSKEDDSDNFYMSWGDLVSLLLVFFIYLFSISEIDVVKFYDAKKSMEGRMLTDTITEETLLANVQNTQKQLYEMKETVDALIQKKKLENEMSVDAQTDRLEVNLGNKVLFEIGSAELRNKAKVILTAVSDIFNESQGHIIVEGHTDDLPINTDAFPSNWELSTARASAVVRHMASQGISGARFVVVGHNQYDPLLPNTSDANRSVNRRVKIVLKPHQKNRSASQSTAPSKSEGA